MCTRAKSISPASIFSGATVVPDPIDMAHVEDGVDPTRVVRARDRLEEIPRRDAQVRIAVQWRCGVRLEQPLGVGLLRQEAAG